MRWTGFGCGVEYPTAVMTTLQGVPPTARYPAERHPGARSPCPGDLPGATARRYINWRVVCLEGTQSTPRLHEFLTTSHSTNPHTRTS
ncbi:hypothetical protein OH77DRAFT_282903 [Trametes cingulata]|nr:hypothetical protein OH77DRAFT_282903 [Trametes cingulata]